jgi:hypothetical protein
MKGYQAVINGRARITADPPPTWYAPQSMSWKSAALSRLVHWVVYFELRRLAHAEIIIHE